MVNRCKLLTKARPKFAEVAKWVALPELTSLRRDVRKWQQGCTRVRISCRSLKTFKDGLFHRGVADERFDRFLRMRILSINHNLEVYYTFNCLV